MGYCGILVNLGAACVVDADNVTLQVGLQIIGRVCEVRSRACTSKRADGYSSAGCIAVVPNVLRYRQRSGGRVVNHLQDSNNIILVRVQLVSPMPILD